MTFTLAQVMVPILIYRVVVTQYEVALESRAIEASTPVPPPQLVSSVPTPAPANRISQSDALNAQLLKAMGMVLESGNPDEIPGRIVDTMLDILRADVGALLRLQDINYADVTVAQDRMMGRTIASMSLNMDNQPTLVNAIERRSQRGMYYDRNVEEMDDLFDRMYIEQRGPVYFQPLNHDRDVFAVLMIANPYTKRELRTEEIELLKGIGAIAGSLLAVSYNSVEAAKYAEDRIIQAMVEGVSPNSLQESDVLQSRETSRLRLEEARREIQSLTKQVSELNHQLANEQNRIASLLGDTPEDLSISQRITAITDEQIQLREERDRLSRRLNEAEVALQGASASDMDTVTNHFIETLKREKEMLEAEKERLQRNLDEVRASDKSVVPSNLQQLINRMMQEKQELEQERNQLGNKLENLQLEMQALGIGDDATGLSQWISRLSEERLKLISDNELLQKERDTLLKARKSFADKIRDEKRRDTQIESLQSKIEKLASDRDVAQKQRDKLKAERTEVINALNNVKEHRARLLAETSGHKLELEEALDEQSKLRAQIQELADLRSQLVHERDRLIAENAKLSSELDRVTTQAGQPASTSAGNDDANNALQAMVEDLSKQRNALEHELNQTRTQLATLDSQLKLAQDSSGNGSEPVYQPQEPELLVGLVQELRTPMTSIAGYIELLLSESAGILGEMQRKFLQRVGANISRLDSMIDSLVHVTKLDTGNYQLEPRPVDLVHMVEDTITGASIQFREKGLAVTLDLDEGLPPIPVDKDAMKQILGQLLTNAYLVSPPDTEIQVTVIRKEVDYDRGSNRNSVYLAIRDSGGGISPEDVPHIFARKWRAENPLIQGLGDTGVGMSIVKALVEAHEGKLWVDTVAGEGSIFAFAIPLDLETLKKRD